VTGDLTIRGITRPVTLVVKGPTLPQKDPWGNVRIGLSATAKISRKDFGLIWNIELESGVALISDSVHITIDAEFIKGLTLHPHRATGVSTL
jgi:polyisoprenoid-binding protein YceI